jgi:hypothetical protein
VASWIAAIAIPVAMEDNAVLELRIYKLKAGTRAAFTRLVLERAMPMLLRNKFSVVGHGPSLHDADSYYLMRAYPSIDERARKVKAFYGGEEWLKNLNDEVMGYVESYNTVVVKATPSALDALRAMLT